MKHIFLLATIAVVTAKLSFTHFHGRSYQGNILLHQNLAPVSQNYDSENGAKQINITEENLSQSCILCQLLRKKTLASVSKCFKKIFFWPLFALYLLIRCDLFNTACLSQISLMTSLDILCSNHLNLKNKITKIEHRKYLLAHQIFLKNLSGPISIHLKYFMTPTKSHGRHSYIVNVRSFIIHLRLSMIFCLFSELYIFL